MPSSRTEVATRLAELRERRWTEADARFVLKTLDESGRSVSAFARDHGLCPQRLWRWRSRLGSSRPVALNHVSFAPLVVTGVGRSPVVLARVGEVEVEIIDPARVDARWAGALLEAVAGIRNRGES